MKVSRMALLLLLGLSGCGGRSEPVLAAEPEWRTLPSGLETRLHRSETDDPAWVRLVRLDPRRHRLRVVTAEPPGLLVSDLAARSEVQAAINGGFFDDTGRPLGWLVADGRELSPIGRAGWGVLVIPENGPPRVLEARTADARGVAQAVQAGPRLVIDGRANPGLKPQVARRSFVGVDGAGRAVLGSTGLVPTDARALARFLAAPEADGGAGLRQALNLDGGSSAQLFVRDGGEDGADLLHPGWVRVPDALVVEARRASDADDDTASGTP